MAQPSFMRMISLLLVTSLALAGACGTEPTERPPPPAPASDLGQDADASSEPDLWVGPNPTTDEIAALCPSACDERNVDGGCVPPEGVCDTICFDAVNGAPEYSEDILACLADDPLCYQSLAQCVWGRVFPAPIDHSVVLRASGYGEWAGAAVTAAIEVSPEVFAYGSSQVGDEGEFVVTIDVRMHALAPHEVLFWLDLNSDGVCDSDSEPTGSATYEFGTRTEVLSVPDWVIEFDRSEVGDGAFVCDFI